MNRSHPVKFGSRSIFHSGGTAREKSSICGASSAVAFKDALRISQDRLAGYPGKRFRPRQGNAALLCVVDQLPGPR
jgi:hypothetical protein